MKIVLVAVMSANGKIARIDKSSIDWNSSEDMEWFKDITKTIGAVVVGRKTFETFKTPLKKRLNIVMTENPSDYKKKENVIYTSDPPEKIVRIVNDMNYSSLAVIGGQHIFEMFLKSKLVNEMYLTYEPVMIDGIDLFKEIGTDVKMNIADLKFINRDTFVVHYIISACT